MDDRFLPENADYVMQVGRLPGRKCQFHHLGRAIKKESIARDLVVMSIDAIKIAVEYKRQVFTVYLLYLQVMQRGQGHDFILFQAHGDMVYFQSQRTALYPNEFIQSLVTLQRRTLMVAGSHGYVAIQAGVQLIIHKKQIVLVNNKDSKYLVCY